MLEESVNKAIKMKKEKKMSKKIINIVDAL